MRRRGPASYGRRDGSEGTSAKGGRSPVMARRREHASEDPGGEGGGGGVGRRRPTKGKDRALMLGKDFFMPHNTLLSGFLLLIKNEYTWVTDSHGIGLFRSGGRNWVQTGANRPIHRHFL